MSSKRVFATAVSVLAAVLIVGVVAWAVLGSSGGESHDGGSVQIIPPDNEVDQEDDAEAVGGAEVPRPAETETPADLVVYITGEVAAPGVYTAAPGQRLADVVGMAGGATEDADLERVNLAAHVSDAGHYRIPAVGESDDAAIDSKQAAAVLGETATGTAESADVCEVPVNINTATTECLETLPGIGGVRAESIVAHREAAGPFATPEGITAVSGIGAGIYGRIVDMITVGSR